MSTKAERRKYNYDLLLKYGFKTEEARRYRDFSKSKIDNLISQRQIEQRKKTRGIEYTNVSNSRKQYLSKYSYIVSYFRKVDGIKEKNYITITSSTKMYKKDVIAEAKETLLEDSNEEVYKSSEILISTLAIELAVYNDKA